MQTAEPVSTREATKRLVKPLKSTYEKEKIKQVAYNATQLVSKKRTQLLRLLDNFQDLFDGTLGDWDTDPANLELKTDSKPFNCKYYPVPRNINKHKSRDEVIIKSLYSK